MDMGLITSVRSLKFSLEDRVIIRHDQIILNEQKDGRSDGNELKCTLHAK